MRQAQRQGRVKARRLTADTYLILDQGYDPGIETWAFAPGTIVRARKERREGRTILLAEDPAEEALRAGLQGAPGRC